MFGEWREFNGSFWSPEPSGESCQNSAQKPYDYKVEQCVDDGSDPQRESMNIARYCYRPDQTGDEQGNEEVLYPAKTLEAERSHPNCQSYR